MKRTIIRAPVVTVVFLLLWIALARGQGERTDFKCRNTVNCSMGHCLQAGAGNEKICCTGGVNAAVCYFSPSNTCNYNANTVTCTNCFLQCPIQSADCGTGMAVGNQTVNICDNPS